MPQLPVLCSCPFLRALPQPLLFLCALLHLLSCVSSGRKSSLLDPESSIQLQEIPVSRRFTKDPFSRHISSLHVGNHKANVISRKEERTSDTKSPNTRSTFRLSIEFSMEDGTDPSPHNAAVTFFSTSPGNKIPKITSFYGNIFAEDGIAFFSIAGVTRNISPAIQITATKFPSNAATMSFAVQGTYFEKDRTTPRSSVTGFSLSQEEEKIVGFVNTIDAPRVFLNSSLSSEQYNAAIECIIFLLLYQREKHFAHLPAQQP